MSRNQFTIGGSARIIQAFAVAATILLMSLTQPVLGQQVTMETLLDRIQIEDLLTRYYYDLSRSNAHELSEYFTEDALLDVDGTIAKGRAKLPSCIRARHRTRSNRHQRRVVVCTCSLPTRSSQSRATLPQRM